MTSGISPSFDDDAYVPPSDEDAPNDVEVYAPRTPNREGRSYSPRRQESSPTSEFRQPPHDVEAEQGVLGAMLLSPQTVIEIVEVLTPEDFYRPAHQLIYSAMIDLFSDNKEIDPVIVAARLDRNNDLERVGGAPYLHTLISSVPTAANARYYAEIVAEKALLRQLVDAGTRVVQLGYEGTEGAEIESVIDLAQQEVFKVNKKGSAEDYAVLGDIIGPTMEELDDISAHGGLAMGVPTGFIDLDSLTNGLHGGQMIIVAARPGVGKSTLALDFVRSCAIKHEKAAVIFSLEMSKSEIAMRLISAEAEVRLSDMRSGKLDDAAWSKLAIRVGQIEQAPIFIDDSANLTMMEIRSKARKLKQKYDLQMIVVDYLQLMSSGRRVESRQQEVSEFSRQLKLLAKELDVPLIAISQLNRGPESRTDKRPQLADLRESGSLEQDADMVMLLYRPDSQDKDNERAGEADIILAKHRGGPIDTVQVAHQLHYSRFVDMARG
ncbi:replicative DNA helicase [Corynebacterium pseudotuberculosis]|uniref:Replicative DNA helicase n=1 Tax=Corynebacterium pseudotuberculosis (strain C231) TaxID=681645 RepID=D9QD42_CORP2|nr:replicative DNA helicase [Corynebacterium pseudotuberculosis]ADK29823.1 replicative DNA helicase [Corynebacterium pseudotuberculosis FRC41]ADL11468.1 replicative DNA helicase [Corynebacterium pseudotuberculosis C231]ADL21880.1 replicative DNA helicase [Corynebacterium pseudotuberculosis 1002]ADO27278.1 replicative DNA helicase [Corynebacterium pseudotuberculosis I19]AEK93339.1 Replicative DNA helicase [Corynebacterium pseudotuberculosis PAT10]